MKAKTLISIILFFTCPLIYGQTNKIQDIQGSWIGKVTFSKDFSLRLILRLEVINDSIKGFIDSPDQYIKDLPIKRVWTIQDSIFADASNIGAGIIFKGLIMPGDSVIDGVWDGKRALRLTPTNYVFTLKTNLNPRIEGYKIIKLIESTPIKDQQKTAACWTYATTSFIETEAIRLGRKPVVLSPMFFVIPTYIDKAEKYIRMNGSSFFGGGDLTFSVMSAYKKYGAIPEMNYSGKKDSTSKLDLNEMNNALLKKVKYYVESGRGNMTTEGYRKDIEDILFQTMAKVPENFIYGQKQYTPKSFAKEMIGINPDEYIEITSYSHHTFYSKVILETMANWNNNSYLNLPIDDFIKVVDNSLLHNYSVCWDGSVHAEGFRDGFAVLRESITNITQQMRQATFDNLTTEDDHNMHIIGIAENDKGNRFYIIKNSTDFFSTGGYLYMSKEYLLLKTISVMVHKNAIPQEILKKILTR